jgi:hypothetical protein
MFAFIGLSQYFDRGSCAFLREIFVNACCCTIFVRDILTRFHAFGGRYVRLHAFLAVIGCLDERSGFWLPNVLFDDVM